MRHSLTASLNRRLQLLPSLFHLQPYLVSPALRETTQTEGPKDISFVWILVVEEQLQRRREQDTTQTPEQAQQTGATIMAGEASAPNHMLVAQTNKCLQRHLKLISLLLLLVHSGSNNASGLLVSLMSAMKLGSLLNLLFG